MGQRLVEEITAARPRGAGPEWWLLLILALDASDVTRRTAPGHEHMTERTGAPRSTLYRWLRKLRADGYIRTVRPSISAGVSGGKGQRAVYEIIRQEGTEAGPERSRQSRVIFADTAAGYLTGFPVVSVERGDELARMGYAKYLMTAEWKARRQAILDWAGNSCQVCSERNRLHVHHRTYVRRGMERPSDLIALCEDCHVLFHSRLPEVDAA